MAKTVTTGCSFIGSEDGHWPPCIPSWETRYGVNGRRFYKADNYQQIGNISYITHESLFITTLIYFEMYFINSKSSCLQIKPL